MKHISRKDLIKARLAELIDLPSRPSEPQPPISDRSRIFGQGLLFLSIFVLVAGLYAIDWGGRAVFMIAALLYAAAGAWHLDHSSAKSDA